MAPEKRLYAGQEVPDGISKNEFKRRLKQQRMDASRDEFLEKRREKRRIAHKTQRQNRRNRPRIVQHDSGVRVVVDCGFDDLMDDSERVSLAGQLTRCYSESRWAPQRVELVISSFNKQLKQRFINEMHATHELWRGVQILESDFAAGPNTIYLTGDAPTTLSELLPGHTYIVGGIVDKNRYKNLCLDKATRMGIPCARLPIDEHIRVSGRRVLTTNQAFELLVRWLEFRDWKKAFEAAIPSRKLGGAESERQTPVAEAGAHVAGNRESDQDDADRDPGESTGLDRVTAAETPSSPTANSLHDDQKA